MTNFGIGALGSDRRTSIRGKRSAQIDHRLEIMDRTKFVDTGKHRLNALGLWLEAKALEAAQQAVQDFVADAQPDEAVNVNAPRDGWDPAPAAAPAKPKAKPRGSPKTIAL